MYTVATQRGRADRDATSSTCSRARASANSALALAFALWRAGSLASLRKNALSSCRSMTPLPSLSTRLVIKGFNNYVVVLRKTEVTFMLCQWKTANCILTARRAWVGHHDFSTPMTPASLLHRLRHPTSASPVRPYGGCGVCHKATVAGNGFIYTG